MCTRLWYSLGMASKPHEILATREARAQLPALLERFRKAGAAAEPVVIGAHRHPEAVVLSYERYLALAGGRERVAALLNAQARTIGTGLDPDQAMELANRELHAMRQERHRSSK
jgi:PHD/YefM family antitoxin component YafN of YafNO toxin-antitoxin module